MFLFSVLLLFLFKGATEGNIQDVDLRCTLEYCEQYTERYPCPGLESLCLNSTTGFLLPSPTTCNCCEFCFTFIDTGDFCPESGLGQSLPKVICKPGTECKGGICQEKKTPDADFYPGYECDGDMCVCALLVNNQPLKIFGQFPANETQEKHCACSIFAYRAQKTLQQILPFPDILLPVPRCLPNGQFDALQCIDDMCGCVNPATGIWDSSVRKVAIGALGPGNPKCFDSKRHQPREYYTVCEKERNEMMQEIFWSERENVEIILSHKVECTPDGRYAN